jgi:TPR repeat protein
MRTVVMAGGALAAVVMSMPAAADVKAGVDAWRRGDYKAAVDQWRPLAISGDPDAQYNLGQAYKLGRGVPVDPVLAESWFGKAAAQGHEQAQENYGIALFQDGKKADAVPWLEKAVGRDAPRAQLVYGTMLFNGDGVARDYPRSYALMTRAAAPRGTAPGLPSAAETLTQMDQYISPADRQRAARHHHRAHHFDP